MIALSAGVTISLTEPAAGGSNNTGTGSGGKLR